MRGAFSEDGVEEESGQLASAEADIVAVLVREARVDAILVDPVVFDEDAARTGGDHHVLRPVAEVREGGELTRERGDVAVGVRRVGGLREVVRGQRELHGLARVVHLSVPVDGERRGNGEGEAVSAVDREAGGEALDQAEQALQDQDGQALYEFLERAALARRFWVSRSGLQ